jgi:diacylglycerol kinase family enzyme
MRAFVILNERSGTLLRDGAEEQKAALVEVFARHRVDATVQIAPGEAIIDGIRRAVEEGDDVIVAGGGDGTLSAAANVLASADLPLGILPFGTLNHFAKDLGVPLELEAAVAAIAVTHRVASMWRRSTAASSSTILR